ncbi:MAG: hypothetical protein SPI76_07145 [Candidatus Fimenecus sp.]|nr:hypothetical protein [Candidatus Fimenecus sp.]
MSRLITYCLKAIISAIKESVTAAERIIAGIPARELLLFNSSAYLGKIVIVAKPNEA